MDLTATSSANASGGTDVLVSGDARLGTAELDAVTRAFAELVVPLGESWSAMLGQQVEVEIGDLRPGPSPRPADAEPAPGSSILDSLTEGGAYCSLGVLGAELGTVGLIVTTPLGLVVVDLLLGGSGRPAGDRTLSDIDLDLLATIDAPTFGALRRLGSPDRIGIPVPLAEDLEEPEIEARLASGLVIDVQLTIGEHTHPFQLVLGAASARHLAGTATSAPIESTTSQNRELLAGVLADVVVEAVVSFPPVLVASHRILGLDVGDVIGLGADPDQPLPLRVDGRRVADVLPARAGSDVACQVVTTIIATPNDGTGHAAARTDSLATGGLL